MVDYNIASNPQLLAYQNLVTSTIGQKIATITLGGLYMYADLEHSL